MSAESSRQFVDANVLVYAVDASAGSKQAAAERLLAGLWASGAGCVSVQVLQEFFVTVTRKVARPLSIESASARVRDYATWRVFRPEAADVLGAITIHKETGISFWDAMVIHAAQELGCDLLWTEDLSDGQRFRDIRVANPFASRA